MGSNQNLFQPEWSQGNLDTIPWLVGILSTVACTFISIIGFGIVIFSIMKNALAGLYAVSPKLWDRVDEIKKANVSARSTEGGNQLINILGSIPTMLCKLLPNIKAMTEFEDEQITPKVYFMKSLPLLCAQIFVGVFIFFGYPAQFANKVQEFGTGVIDIVFANVDPLAWAERLPGEMTSYDFVTKGSDIDFDKNILEISQAATKTLVGYRTEILKSARQDCAYAIESWALSAFSSSDIISYMSDRDTWTMSASASYSPYSYADKALEGGGTWPKLAVEADGTAVSYQTEVAVDTLPTGSKDAGSGAYVVVTLTFTKNSVDGSSAHAGVPLTATLYVPNNMITVNGTGTGTISIKNLSGVKLKGSTVTVYNADGTASQSGTANMVTGTTTLTITGASYSSGSIVPGNAVSITYFDGTNTVKITSIQFGTGSEAKLVSDGYSDWKLGDPIPTNSGGTDSGTGGTTTNTNSSPGI